MLLRRSRCLSRLLLLAPLAALLASGPTAGMLCHAGSPEKVLAQPSPRPTIEPQLPLDFRVDLVSLEKNPRGGVASLLLTVGASVSIAEAVVSAKVPGNLVFADGSKVKTWNVSLETAGTRSIAVEVIVPQDGKYHLSAELAGIAQGKPIHRGAAYRLLVGAGEPSPKAREGAIEYPALPDGDPTP